jgi:CDK5 regulatory subunit-associated protein 3
MMGSPGLWLGEAAMTLTRNVDFEAPAVKKANARTQQQLIDLQRRQEEYLHSAAAAATAYKQVLAWDVPTARVAKLLAEKEQGLMLAGDMPIYSINQTMHGFCRSARSWVSRDAMLRPSCVVWEACWRSSSVQHCSNAGNQLLHLNEAVSLDYSGRALSFSPADS